MQDYDGFSRDIFRTMPIHALGAWDTFCGKLGVVQAGFSGRLNAAGNWYVILHAAIVLRGIKLRH